MYVVNTASVCRVSKLMNWKCICLQSESLSFLNYFDLNLILECRHSQKTRGREEASSRKGAVYPGKMIYNQINNQMKIYIIYAEIYHLHKLSFDFVYNFQKKFLKSLRYKVHLRINSISSLLNFYWYIFSKTFTILNLHQNLIKCYHCEIIRMYAKFTQDSGQMFLLVLFYIFFESQFMNYWVGFLRNANWYEMCKMIFK